MPVPDYQAIMLPLLTTLADRRTRSNSECVASLAEHFSLTDADRRQLLPSGQQYTFDNRVHWAATYLTKAGLLHRPQRGHIQITDRGLEILHQRPANIDVAFLEQFPEFAAFRAQRSTCRVGSSDRQLALTDERTPEETLEDGYARLRRDLAAELLQGVKDGSPAFFERLVVDLLLKMGYGGTRSDAGQAIGGASDGGIDGIINEDRLGLDVVYIQAKRWDAVIGRPEIQRFAGALQGQRARKGIFITTSSFTKEAREYASRIDSRIVLIDGDELAQLMIDYDIGVTRVASYDVKKVDTDYFSGT